MNTFFKSISEFTDSALFFPLGSEEMNEESENRRPGPHNIIVSNRNHGRGREGWNSYYMILTSL